MNHHVRNEHQRAVAVKALCDASLPCRVEIHEGEDRSAEQNRLAFKWYGEIAQQRHMTPDEAHRRCKLRYGVPILCRDSEDFCGVYERVLAPLSDAAKLDAMHIVEVSRLFNVAQMSEYLDTIYREQSMQGIRLTDPGVPAVGRVADGIPRRVDRLRALGNAVVPQVVEQIGRAVMQVAENEAGE